MGTQSPRKGHANAYATEVTKKFHIHGRPLPPKMWALGALLEASQAARGNPRHGHDCGVLYLRFERECAVGLLGRLSNPMLGAKSSNPTDL
jgi:hypothetical protein